MILRLIVAAGLGLLVSLLVFQFMMGLIVNNQSDVEENQTITQLQMVEPPPEPDELEPEPEQVPDEVAEEPEMDAMEVTAPAPVEAPEMEAPEMDLSSLSGLSLPEGSSAASTWKAPLSLGEDGFGKKGEGYVEVIPLSTRRPNIPEVAWKKKIDGWVLVAFTVMPSGKTKNVRILDSFPRGIFEEKSIQAVEDWIYDSSDIKRVKGEVVLTQKIELFWENYPQNNNHLDD